jgi:hypothetical protein
MQMTRRFAVLLALVALGGCASVMKQEGTRVCQDGCQVARKSCGYHPSGSQSGLSGAARELAEREANTACDATLQQCLHECG